MKPFSLIIAVIVSFRAFSQEYSDSEVLLESKYSNYLIIRDTVAFYDIWGGKKNPYYQHKDTLKKKNSELFIGKMYELRFMETDWVLTKRNQSFELRFKIASKEEHKNWTNVINWTIYKKVIDDANKSESLVKTERYKNDIKELFEAHRVLTINEYKKRTEIFKKTYGL